MPDNAPTNTTTPSSAATTLPSLPKDNDLPPLDLSATLSRLAPLDLALKSSLQQELPIKGQPDPSKTLVSTLASLQKYQYHLSHYPLPSNDTIKAKTFEWLVAHLEQCEILEREVQRCEVLLDCQIFEGLWEGSEFEKGVIERELEGRKARVEERRGREVREVAEEKAEEMVAALIAKEGGGWEEGE